MAVSDWFSKFKVAFKTSWKNFKTLIQKFLVNYGMITIGLGVTGYLVTPRLTQMYDAHESVKEHKRDSLLNANLDARFEAQNNQFEEMLTNVFNGKINVDSLQYAMLLKDIKKITDESWRKAPVYITRYLNEEKEALLTSEIMVTDERGRFLFYEYYVKITADGVYPEVWQKIRTTQSLKSGK